MTYSDFLNALGDREFSGDYGVVNSLGYLGKYQFGELALIDVGYYTADGTADNDWQQAHWTGKGGVHSKADFLADHAAQENAIRAYMQLQWSYLGDARKYEGQVIHGIAITVSGLLAGAHLVGAGTVATFLDSGGKTVPKDGYGTPVTEYLETFAGYDTPFAADHSGAEQIGGGPYADILRGFGGDDSLDGSGGDDRLKGGAGNDLIDGGAGHDRLVGGRGNDAFRFDAALSSSSGDSLRGLQAGNGPHRGRPPDLRRTAGRRAPQERLPQGSRRPRCR